MLAPGPEIATSDLLSAGKEPLTTNVPPTQAGSLLGGGVQVVPRGDKVAHVKSMLASSGWLNSRILRDREFGHVFGHPMVIVGERNGSAFVLLRCVRNERKHGEVVTVVECRPWGWPNIDKEFLNPDSPAVDNYAFAVFGLVQDLNRGEHSDASGSKTPALRSGVVRA